MVRRMDAIKVKNLNFNYGEKVIFKNFNLTIKKGDFVTISGKNCSGKSTLCKIIYGDLKYNGEVYIYNDLVNFKNVKIFQENIAFIYDFYDEFSFSLSVHDEFYQVLNNEDRVVEMAKLLGLFKDLYINCFELSFKKRKLVALGIALLKRPSILILDNAFEGIDEKIKKKVINIIKKNKVTVLNVTHDVEDFLISDRIVIIDNGIKFEGTYKRFFNESLTDFEMPFIVNLSYKLKFYDLIDKIYYSEKALVDDLWKM